MYICKDCGCVFDEAYSYEERHPYGDTYASEYFSCCPACGGDYDEAVRCADCGEWVSEEELHSELCEECFLERRKEIANAIMGLFTKNQFDCLPDDIFDDIWSDVENAYKESGSK